MGEALSTLNVDLIPLADDLNRYMKEILLSQSANGSKVKQADKLRFRSYLSALRFAMDSAARQPELDVPETNPMQVPLSASIDLIDIENTAVKQLARMLWMAREELLRSGSTRESSGVLPADKKRFEDLIAKAEDYIANYIEKATPLDLPESSPSKVLQGPGSMNPINP